MQGRSDDAVSCYLRLKNGYVSKAMEDGKRIHEEIATFVTENKRLPDFMPQIPLVNPVVEKKHILPFNDQFDLSVVFDLIDSPRLFEFKTGTQDSLRWAGTYQLPLYFLAAKILEIDVKVAFLIHYNQHTEDKDFVVVHNNHTAIKRAINLIETIGPEIYNFFDEQGLI